jgi:16S rRNA (cytidine1402-2'-O)-methyltransferase
MALMASGFNGQSFAFHGYLPIEQRRRKEKIQLLEKEAYQSGQTQIFMETPYRNDQMLEDLLATCKPFTQLCVARDISGTQHLNSSKTIREWRKNIVELHKLPTVFLLYKG